MLKYLLLIHYTSLVCCCCSRQECRLLLAIYILHLDMARGIEDVEESRSCTQSWLAYNQRKLNCIAVVVGGATNDVLAMSENKIDKIVQAGSSE